MTGLVVCPLGDNCLGDGPKCFEAHRLTELAWAAGFFEGEGTVSSATTKYGRRRIRAAVSQNGRHAPTILQRFVDAVGVGKLLGPYDYAGKYPNTPTKKPRYVVQYQNRRTVDEVIGLLAPFMSSDSPKLAKYAELSSPEAGAK